MPPVVVRSAVPPLVMAPEESSTKCTVNEPGVPLKFAAGTKWIKSVDAISSALLVVTAGNGVQLEPPSVEYSQAPCPTVAALAVTATPAKLFAAEPPLAV